MMIGVVFPQTEIGSDPGAIRAYVQGVEALGFHHLVVYDHVVGADSAGRKPMPYTTASMFHEPFVLFGWLAAITQRLELVTGIVILPQRQTVLVAKQAAEIDVLSGGRLRLGVGIGWNTVEFEALNEDFTSRAARIEEQVEVLRRLWREPVVDFRGRWHTVDRAGLNPLPVQRPIPIWFGGSAEAAMRRIARIADGWMPNKKPPEGWDWEIERMRRYVQEAGRDPGNFGIEGRLNTAKRSPEECHQELEGWQKRGATYLDVNTMGAGLQGADAHLKRLQELQASGVGG
ncbi:MAG: LLM class F420-dependent oxidoreductase [Candidatus Xenobia bacterium]